MRYDPFDCTAKLKPTIVSYYWIVPYTMAAWCSLCPLQKKSARSREESLGLMKNLICKAKNSLQ